MWTWARDDFFPLQLTLNAAPAGVHRVAVVSDSDMQGDANHRLGLSAGKTWRPWTVIGTQSEFADQNWELKWSKDGSLVALRQSPGMLGDKSLKAPLYTHAFDFFGNKSHQAAGYYPQFSASISKMLKQRDGATTGRESKRDLGVWRWEDRAIKDAL